MRFFDLITIKFYTSIISLTTNTSSLPPPESVVASVVAAGVVVITAFLGSSGIDVVATSGGGLKV